MEREIKMKKRYAIVRAGKDGSCVEEFVCSGNCNKCDYGDTKEQLVAKVNQILQKAYEERTGNYGYSLKFYEPIARKIVEFLGVEE